jgi:hypothetical protein
VLKQSTDVTRLAVLGLLVALALAWGVHFHGPQTRPQPVRGPDSWGMPAQGWYCFDAGDPLPHQSRAPTGDHVCTQAQVANEPHASATR